MTSPFTPTSLSQGKLFGDKPTTEAFEYQLGSANNARQRAMVVAWRNSIVRTFPRRTTSRRGVITAAWNIGINTVAGGRARRFRSAFVLTAITLAVVSAIVFFAASRADATPNEADRLVNTSGIPAKVAELGANAGPATRVAAALPERDALAQIKEMAGRSNLEEQWAYLPDHDLWIEIGINEEANATGSQVEADSALLQALMTGFAHIDLYHFHPDAYFEGNAVAFSSETPAAHLSTKALASVGLALPSPADIQTSLEMTLLARSLGSKVELRHFVVSPLGVVAYGLTKRGDRKLFADQGNPRSLLGHEIMVTTAVRRGPVNIASTLHRDPTCSIGRLLNRLGAQMSGDLYAVSFEPHREGPRKQTMVLSTRR